MAHEHYTTCIEACNSCADACDHCATACLAEANPKPMARCIALDMDCAAICRMAAGFMARDSEFAESLCTLCAEICDACGAQCESTTCSTARIAPRLAAGVPRSAGRWAAR